MEVNPPYVLQGGTEPGPDHPAILFRRVLGGFFGEGVAAYNGDDDCLVTPGTGMQVSVARGGTYVQGDNVTAQGLYFCYNDAAVTLSVPASDNSNPRKDIVVARVRDEFHGTSGDDWVLDYIAGTPAQSPNEPTLPATAYKLATVDVAAMTSSIGAGDITDQRERASLVELADGSVTKEKIANGAVGFNRLEPGVFNASAATGPAGHFPLATTEWTTLATTTVTGPGKYLVLGIATGAVYECRANFAGRIAHNGVQLLQSGGAIRSSEALAIPLFAYGDLSEGDNDFDVQALFEIIFEPDASKPGFAESYGPNCHVLVVKFP